MNKTEIEYGEMIAITEVYVFKKGEYKKEKSEPIEPYNSYSPTMKNQIKRLFKYIFNKIF